MKIIDVVSFGEALIDFTYVGNSKTGMKLFEQNPGGAPANVACSVAKLGGNSGFIGKIGKDMHGDFLLDVFMENHVNIEGIVRGNEPTTMAFVSLNHDGERTFSFARNHSADTMISSDEINEQLIRDAKILSIGSLSMTDEPARHATLRAIDIAKSSSTLVAYDPNYRPALWKNSEIAKETIVSILDNVDLLKVSDEEAFLITGFEDLEKAALFLSKKGIRIVAITLGAKGSLVCVDGQVSFIPAYLSVAIDTTGAGDAFWGGFMYSLLNSKMPFDNISIINASGFTKFGNATAACCVRKRGAIPSLPTLSEVESVLLETTN